MLTVPEYAATFGTRPLHADVNLLLHTFRTYYSLGLILSGFHLMLIGAPIVRAKYMPRWLGASLVIDGAGWIATELQPYLFPNVNVDRLFYTFLGELLLMLWLLIVGWRIKQPQPALAAAR